MILLNKIFYLKNKLYNIYKNLKENFFLELKSFINYKKKVVNFNS